jgi:hypothetical protein
MDTTELKTYKSKCHCGKFAFEFTQVPGPFGSAKALECNCSICHIRGYVLV